MRASTLRRAGAILVAAAAVVLTATPANAAVATPQAKVSQQNVAGVQPGTAGQKDNFLTAHANMLGRELVGHAAAATIHPSAGTAFIDKGNDQGAFATQSVTTAMRPTDGGTTIYTPTLYPAGGSCIEVTTVYTNSTQAVEAWDWCNHINFEASVPINSSFITKYTNGASAYTVEILRTNATNNTWVAYLYNYSTKAYDTLYTSSGKSQAGTTGWDVNELYSNVQSNGQSYACTDMAGKTFSASNIQVDLGGTWQAAAPGNSDTRFDSGNAAFDCSSRTYQMITQYSHWQVVG
jgi:hypothetical protein